MDDCGYALLEWRKPGAEVTCYAVEAASTSNHANRPLDNNFSIQVCYQDNQNVAERSTRVELARESEWPDIQVAAIKCLEELDVDGNAYDGAIDTVVESCDKLLGQVSSVGRKSLAMIVKIYVDEDLLAAHVEDNGFIDYMEDIGSIEYQTVDVMDEVMDEDEEVDVTEEEEKMGRILEARNCLWRNGVSFIGGDQVSCDNDIGCCSICLEELGNWGCDNDDVKPDEVALLPCSHVLHGDCLISWILEDKDSCPLCRSKLLPCMLGCY